MHHQSAMSRADLARLTTVSALGYLVWVTVVRSAELCGGDSTVEDLAASLQTSLSSQGKVLTQSNSPATSGSVLQGYAAPGAPQDYGAVSAIIAQPAGKLFRP